MISHALACQQYIGLEDNSIITRKEWGVQYRSDLG